MTGPGPLTRTVMVRQVGAIALPILLSSLVSLFAPLANAAVIGHVNPAYLYVLGLALPMILLQNSVNESLRVSSVAFSSQASGTGDLVTFHRRLRGLITVGVLINLGIAVLFLLGHQLFLDVYAVPPDRQSLTFHFVQVNILTGALLMVSVGLMSTLYGLRQVRAVTVVTVASLVTNVALTAATVTWLGIFALPVATTLTASATIVWASRRLGQLGIHPWRGGNPLRAAVASGREIVRISLPVALGYLLIFANSLVFNRVLAMYQPTDIAGFGIAYRVQNLVVMPGIALGIGLAINVNRMVAQGRPGRVPAYMATIVGLSSAVFVVLATVVFLTRSFDATVLTGDPAIAAAAAHYLAYLAPAYLVVGPMLTLLIFLEETGNGFRALSFNLGLVTVQLALAYYLAGTGHQLSTVYLAITMTYVVAIVFIGHELVRARRLGGRVSMITAPGDGHA